MNSVGTTLDTISEVFRSLNTTALDITTYEQRIVEQRQELKEYEQSFEERRAENELLISNVTDDRGKSIYSNESARKAALVISMRDDREARVLAGHINRLTSEIALLQVSRDDASRKRQNTLAVSSLLSSWLHYHAPVPTLGGE